VVGEGEARFLYYLLLRGYLCLTRGEGVGSVGGEMDPADLERVRRARRRLDSLGARNYFQVLEVNLEASDGKVREAYLRKAKDVHPDMLGPHDPADLRRIHEETFRVVQTAYESLKTDARRRDYLRFIQEGIEKELSPGTRFLEAETLFQEGRALMKRQAWEAAAEAFRRALELNTDEGEYALHLGIAKMRLAGTGREGALAEAEELFQRALGLMPSSPEPSYRLGRIAALRGETEQAATLFQKALAKSPNHIESLRELRLIRLRTDKKGVFTSMTGKRETK
jgi:curved DNA-binding protein CbpA